MWVRARTWLRVQPGRQRVHREERREIFAAAPHVSRGLLPELLVLWGESEGESRVACMNGGVISWCHEAIARARARVCVCVCVCVRVS